MAKATSIRVAPSEVKSEDRQIVMCLPMWNGIGVDSRECQAPNIGYASRSYQVDRVQSLLVASRLASNLMKPPSYTATTPLEANHLNHVISHSSWSNRCIQCISFKTPSHCHKKQRPGRFGKENTSSVQRRHWIHPGVDGFQHGLLRENGLTKCYPGPVEGSGFMATSGLSFVSFLKNPNATVALNLWK